jgi:hypothetical protein
MATQHVSNAAHWLARLSQSAPSLWKTLGTIETRLLGKDWPEINAPIYISGLARSGSTLLLEILAAHRDVGTHQYRDFPFMMTPYLWNTAVSLNPLHGGSRKERPHGDGMMVTPQSPEAMEEMLWMAFFETLHTDASAQVMDAGDTHPEFDRFYREHIQKLMMIRRATRYASKNNYNITRMDYVKRLFPDARFIIPVREPASHIASLMRQHERFSNLAADDARVSEHMHYAGHFEFGPGRKAIHTGDDARHRAIMDAWACGDDVRGWALYWDMSYRFLYEQQAKHSVLIVKLEDMRTQPEATIEAVLRYCALEQAQSITEHFTAQMKPRDEPVILSKEEHELIAQITASTAALYGYA